MLLEVVIGLGVFLFVFWKYLLPSKQGKLAQECQPVEQKPQNVEPVVIRDVAENKTETPDPPIRMAELENTLKSLEDESTEAVNCFATPKIDEKYDYQSPQRDNKQFEEIISPSVLLEKQEKLLNEKNVSKRESPPKERLSAYLEKTVLCDDKINSIINNLSLGKLPTKLPLKESPFLNDLTITPIVQAQSKKLENGIHENLNRLFAPNENEIHTRDYNDNHVDKENKVNIIPKEEQKDEPDCKPVEPVEPKPILKRFQPNPGFPGGLNFGSVIGELKNKTKNGGLKPVFRKFDIDASENITQENLNSVDEKKKDKAIIEDNEVSANILADRRTKLETAAQGWRKRVPQSDASLFTVAGRLERDKASSPAPLTPPAAPAAPAVPALPTPNKFRSRKAPPSPTNGLAPSPLRSAPLGSGPLRSASCAVVNAALVEPKPDVIPARDVFKRSQSVNEGFNRIEGSDSTPERAGAAVRVPRADDETFLAFYTPVLERVTVDEADVDVDLDAIDSANRLLLANDYAKRAKRSRKQAGSRNPLRALAARTDLRHEYQHSVCTVHDHENKEKATTTPNHGLAAEALAALATKEDFSAVSLRSAAAAPLAAPAPLMLLHVKGRRRVQTRLVQPVFGSVNRGDCFVLLSPEQLMLYVGQYANVIEKNRSTDILTHIQSTKDLGCKCTSAVIIDEQTKNYTSKQWNQFWTTLGVKENVENYRPADTGHPDEDEIYENCIIQTNMCYEVIDDELVPIKEYWGQAPKIAMLNQSKVIVFDFGSEMYIWYGKNVPLETRRRAAQLAQELFDEGYNYEDCHINPVNAAVFQGARDENSTAPVKTSKTRPEWAILSKISQHMETILFKEKFVDWPDYSRVIKVKPQENKTNSLEITPCDAEEMWANEYIDPDLILEGSHVGRGTHYYDKENMRHYDIKTRSVCKWVIQEFDFQKVENEADIPDFYSADSYIIRWEYIITATGRELNGKPSKHNITGRDRCAYFCWQGRDASSNDKGAAALLTVELDKEKGPQIRVAQGNEPPAFLNLFQGNLTIHQGKKNADKSRYKLFVTRGNVSNEAYLLQVPCSVRQLRSRGSLLLVDTEKGCLYIWHGARSLKHTKNIAIELANKLIARESTYLFGAKKSNLKITEVKEGDEPKEVLEALGCANKQYYNSVLNGKDASVDVTARLFHFTDLGGQFEAQEVLSPLRHDGLVTPFPFEQKELYSASQPALFLLDAGGSLWLWQGWWPRAADGELESKEINIGVGAFAARWQAMRAAALRTAEAYYHVSRTRSTLTPGATDTLGADVPRVNGTQGTAQVKVVAAGLEPKAFTDLFDCWTEHDEAAEANIEHGYKCGDILSGACELSRLSSTSALVPLAALQRRPLPDHVDPMRLERHLDEADFQEAFAMTKEEFAALPPWKQTNMKKEVGLF